MSHSAQNRSFRRRFSQPISWRSTEETKPNNKSKQVVKVIWHKAALLPQMDGLIVFAKLHHCALRGGHIAPMCPQGRAHWRNLANMIELVLSVVHPSPQRKRQIDWFGHFCIALGRVSSGMPGHILFPNNCPFAWWICTTYLVHNFLGPYKLITQTASRSVRPFLHSSPPSIPVLYNGTPLFQKMPPSHGENWISI